MSNLNKINNKVSINMNNILKVRNNKLLTYFLIMNEN
jgi:hypothetical protein